MSWPKDAQWYAILVALFMSVFAGVIQKWVKSLFWKPKLEISIRVEPPDCDKYPLINRENHTPEGYGYHFRFRIYNSGNYPMQDVEVMATELHVKNLTGEYEKNRSFVPLNLEWSYYGNIVMPLIQASLSKHCDFGSIIKTETARKKGYGVSESCQVVFLLSTRIKLTTGTFLLVPGEYKLKIVVAGTNVQPVEKIYEVVAEDRWTDDREEMFEKNVSITEVKSLN